LFRRDANFLQDFATPDAGIRIDPRERIIIIPRFEVGLFLLGELCTRPGHKRYVTIIMRQGTRNML
jgi:hypothetical protein